MLKRLFLLVMVLSLSTGCALFGAVIGALPTIIQIVQDAEIILDQIDIAAKPFFERAENKDLLREYNTRMFTAKRALQVALRASEGGKELSDDEIDAAFDDFKVAYKELLALLRDNKLMSDDGKLRVSPTSEEQIHVEIPLALSRKK